MRVLLMVAPPAARQYVSPDHSTLATDPEQWRVL
jgi:hypothetical protein